MSKRHPGSRRTHQEPSSDPDDLFIAKILEVGNWARANQQLVTIPGVVVAISVAGLVYYTGYRETLVEQAAEQLESVHQSIVLQDIEGAKNELITFLERFSGTAYEGEARLLLGDLYLQTTDPQQARQVLAPHQVLGRSNHEIEELVESERIGADHVAFGAIYHTDTKGVGGPPQGIEGADHGRFRYAQGGRQSAHRMGRRDQVNLQKNRHLPC